MSYEFGTSPEDLEKHSINESGGNFQELSHEDALRRNDLQTSETYQARARQLLEAAHVNFEIIEKSKRQDSEKGYAPGQYVFRVFDPNKAGAPATVDYVKSVYSYLRENQPDMPIAFGDPALRGG